jgi:acetyl-CoA carboxylase carboxyltransferase component
MIAFKSPLAGRVAAVLAHTGAVVRTGQTLVVMESMKMEHELAAPVEAVVGHVHCAVGQEIGEGDLLLVLEQQMSSGCRQTAVFSDISSANETDSGDADVAARRRLTADEARPQAMAKRHAAGLRSARENLADLCDAGSFVEYGALAIAAQQQRRGLDDLRAQTPADGLVCGTAMVGGTKVAVAAYDATVLAGTQGMRNHQKLDRMLDLAAREALPFLLFAEGGGGRPGDTDMPIIAGLHVTSFAALARLRGRVPLIGVAAGRCFAGNAALLGMCDIVIATRSANIGLGGPAMIEGAGLGRFAPEDIGAASDLARCGVVDVVVEDEAQAVARAKQALAFWQGPCASWAAPPDDALAGVIPAQRNRAFDGQALIDGLVDHGSALPWQDGWGQAVHTHFARIEGRPVGVLASHPEHMAGALDAAATQKLERFLARCRAWQLPVVSLIDTPGFMVGPQSERLGQVRHAGRLFAAAAQLGQKWVSVVVRRGFGLGAMALAGGGFHESHAMAAWPKAEFGAMGLEGAVQLGWRKELDALTDDARAQREAELLQRMIEEGSALRMAETLEIDAVITPRETRAWVARALG